MKLFLVLIILLFEVPTDAVRPKKCFNNIAGYCRKKCEMGEISEMSCLNGKLCCVNEGRNKKQEEAKDVLQAPLLTDQKLDYIILPTITVLTIQP
uniref:Beta-defensin n=1 Tax=Rousettus aegyptiacus TaxID=9407 RepID=A0A7J8DFX3_ROUAE|nr:defensin beta 128 [Rousettus aegyptiacus]